MTVHPCGHARTEAGCGGCDPGAIEFVLTDSGAWRPFDPARDLTTPSPTSPAPVLSPAADEHDDRPGSPPPGLGRSASQRT